MKFTLFEDPAGSKRIHAIQAVGANYTITNYPLAQKTKFAVVITPKVNFTNSSTSTAGSTITPISGELEEELRYLIGQLSSVIGGDKQKPTILPTTKQIHQLLK